MLETATHKHLAYRYDTKASKHLGARNVSMLRQNHVTAKKRSAPISRDNICVRLKWYSPVSLVIAQSAPPLQSPY